MIVLDASVLVDLLLGPDLSLEQRVFDAGEALHAPHLIDVETVHVLRRYARMKAIRDTRAALAIEDLVDFPITRHGHDLLLPRIWSLRHAVSAYDAAYVALAEALNAPLITRDRRLSKLAGHAAAIEVF